MRLHSTTRNSLSALQSVKCGEIILLRRVKVLKSLGRIGLGQGESEDVRGIINNARTFEKDCWNDCWDNCWNDTALDLEIPSIIKL